MSEVASEYLECGVAARSLSVVAAAFPKPSDRLEAEWQTFDNNRGTYPLTWEPGNFTHKAMYRRGLRMLGDPAITGLPKENRIGIRWYTGRLGLLAGAPPKECLAHFAAGIALSPPRSHNIVCDHHALAYALAVLAGDADRAEELRRQAECPQSPFQHEFEGAVRVIAQAALLQNAVGEFS